jgi:hypothetical protein
MATLYDTDFVRWSETQATALRERRYDELDIENLAEEVESLSRSDRRALRSHLKGIMQHLLKAKYTGVMLAGWEATTIAHRDAAQALLEESPSLRREVPGMLEKVYPLARRDAARELRVPVTALPETCPFTPEEVLGS